MYHFILNPVSGGGRGARTEQIITTIMERKKLPYKIWITKNAVDVKRFAISAASHEAGAEALVAVGGDGTVSEVAAIAMNSGVPFGVVAAGSGNDFAASLFGKKIKASDDSVKRDILTILNGKTKPIDMLSINDMGFINISNFGIDSEIVKNADSLKRHFGKYAYLAATVKSVFTFKPMKLSVDLDGKKLSGTYMLAAFCNGHTYGGLFHIAPKASISDGKITICLVKNMPKIKILFMFPRVLFGKHERLREVRFYECERAVVSFGGKLTVSVDGNIFKYATPIEFSIKKAAIDIFVR